MLRLKLRFGAIHPIQKSNRTILTTSETGASNESLNLYSNISTHINFFKILYPNASWLELILIRYYIDKQNR